MRIGHGYDVHRLVEERKLIMGGVDIPYEKGLLGHSDADVLLHAIMDALLGAAAMGDIGKHFPDNDPRYSGADSMMLTRHVAKLLHDTGYSIVNIDATVIAQAPKLLNLSDRWSYGVLKKSSVLQVYSCGTALDKLYSAHRPGDDFHQET